MSEKLDMQSPDMVAANVDKIAAIFPNCVTETADGKAVDFDLLKQELNNQLVEGTKERYRLEWPGKREAIVMANLPTTKTLRPVREDSVDFDTTENLYIEGDNLEVLKLLQESYLNKIKMIYIDPPYNTGKDFVYKDNFTQDTEEFKEESGLVDEEKNRMLVNPETSGRYHSDWLSMMYPRLKLAKNLMTEDGVIFISIDSNELHNLRKVCDEIFSEGNFIESISWNKRVPKNDKGIGSIHEYILIYVKNSTLNHQFLMPKEGLEEINLFLSKLKKQKTPIHEAEDEIKKLYKKKGYDRGITLYNSLDDDYRLWGKINMSWPNADTFGPRYDVLHPQLKRPVKVPERGWRWKEETFNEAANRNEGNYSHVKKLHDGSFICGSIWFDKDANTQPSSINYLDEIENLLLRSIISLKSDGGIELEKIFDGKSYFSYPKPTSILNLLFKSVKGNDGYYLDFFSGSAASADAIVQLNAEDDGNRKFIMVQVPEIIDEKSEAYKAGYKNICEIGKERIRRAGKKIKESLNQDSQNLKIKQDVVAKKSKDKGLVSMFETEKVENEKEVNAVNAENSDSDKKENQTGKLDIGFRVYRLAESNMKDVYYRPQDFAQDNLELFEDNIKPDRTADDLLTQVILDWGLSLSLPIEQLTIANKHVFKVAENSLFACFDSNVDEAFAKELATYKPLRVVFKDKSFKDNSAKENVKQLLKQLSADTEMKVI
jgi:adenine-specific DNA-methyltransferase